MSVIQCAHYNVLCITQFQCANYDVLIAMYSWQCVHITMFSWQCLDIQRKSWPLHCVHNNMFIGTYGVPITLCFNIYAQVTIYLLILVWSLYTVKMPLYIGQCVHITIDFRQSSRNNVPHYNYVHIHLCTHDNYVLMLQ